MSNKRQWYAIRQDLQKRGLWRYAEAVGKKKVAAKRKAPEPAPDDPDEGTSEGTAAKLPCEYGESDEIYHNRAWDKYSRRKYRVSKGCKVALSGTLECGSIYHRRRHTISYCVIYEI